MGFRLFQLFALVFWLGTVTWLGLTVWAPPESRMREVDPREAIDAFFQWNETTNMALLENGRRRGQLTVAGGSGDDEDEGLFLNSLSVSGTLESDRSEEGQTLIGLFGRGVVQFRRDLSLHDGEFSIRIPAQRLTAHIRVEGEPETMAARVLLDGIPIFEYASGEDEEPPDLPETAATMVPGLEEGLAGVAPENWTWDVKVRRGTYRIAGRDVDCFLMTLVLPGAGQEVRAYLSEAGEPLRIETDLGYEAISEMLVPLGAYQSARSSRS